MLAVRIVMRSLLASLVLVSVSACGPLVSGDVVVNDICADSTAIEFAALPMDGSIADAGVGATLPDSASGDRITQALHAPQGNMPLEGTIETTSTLTIPAEILSSLQEFPGARIELTSVMLAPEGVPDLSFVKAASMSADINGERQSLASGTPMGGTTNLVLRPVAPVDVTELVKQGTAEVSTKLTATFPQTAWKLHVRTCFKATSHVQWSP